jgi:hypothetical protein
MPKNQAPGIQYPNIRSHVAPAVDDAIRNAFDNLFYLRTRLDAIMGQVSTLSAGQTAQVTQQIKNEITNLIGGGSTTISTGTTALSGTHAERLSTYSSPLPAVGTIYYETDRNSYYEVVTNLLGVSGWVLIAAYMVGAIASRPADLATADQGFTFYATDATETTEYIWTGAAWVSPIPDASATVRGAVTTGVQSFAGNKNFTGSVGVGVAPTAALHLRAGTAAADTAPLRFTTGVNLAAPVAGTMEFSSSILYFTPSATQYPVLLSTFPEAQDITFGTVTGTKIGTAANQKLAFYNATPIVQPSGDILAKLSALGLITSPTLGYGSMYGDDISQAVVVVAANTSYEVGGSLLTSLCDTNAWTFQNSKELKCLVQGIYLITWSMTVSCVSASQGISGCVMEDGVANVASTNHGFGESAAAPVSLSGSVIISVAVNGLISLAAANNTSTDDLVVQHANLTIIRVG